MQGVKVNREELRMDGDFRSLGSSGVFDALPGSRYGSSVDLTEAAKARPLPKALQPRTVKHQEQRSSSYRQPVVALPPRDPLMKGSSEAIEGRRYGYTERSNSNYGDQSLSNQTTGNQLRSHSNYGDQSLSNQTTGNQLRSNSNYGDQTLSNQTTGNQLRSNSNYGDQTLSNQTTSNQLHSYQSLGSQILASKPKNFFDAAIDSSRIRNQHPGRGLSASLRNLECHIDPTTHTSGAAQAHEQTLWVEKTLKGGGQPMRKMEKENRTWQNDVGQFVPLANSRNRRNSDSYADQNSTNSVQNSYNSILNAAISAKPRSTRYGSLCDLSMETESTQGDGRQAGRDVDSYGLLLRTSGLRTNAANPLGSSDVFGSSDPSDQRRGPLTSGSDHVTGNAWTRGRSAPSQANTSGLPVGRSSSTQRMVDRVESWIETEKTSDLFTARENDYHSYSSSSPMSRNRRSSFDQTWPRKENNHNIYPTLGVSSRASNPSMPPENPSARAEPPEERANTMQTPFRERSQSATFNRLRGYSGDPRNRQNQGDDSAALALRSSRYPSAKMTHCEGDVMHPGERVVPSPWATQTAPSNSGDTRDDQSSSRTISSTQPPMETRSEACFRDDMSSNPGDCSSDVKVDEVKIGDFSSDPCALTTSESSGNRTESLRSAVQFVPEVSKYAAKQNHITTSSSSDVRSEGGYHPISDLPTSEQNFTRRLTAEPNRHQGHQGHQGHPDGSNSTISSTGVQGMEKSPFPRPMPSYSWQTTRRSSLPTVDLGRKDITTRGKGGNYESIFSKGDYINAARMTWKGPFASSRASLAVEKPASAGGRDNLPLAMRTPADSRILSATSSANQPMSEQPVGKLERLERIPVESTLHEAEYKISRYTQEPDANFHTSSSGISAERATSGSFDSSRQSPNAKVPEYSRNERPDAMNSRESALVELSKSVENRNSVTDREDLMKRPEFVQDTFKILEETKKIKSSDDFVKQSSSKSCPDWKTPEVEEDRFAGSESKKSVEEFTSDRSGLESRMSEWKSPEHTTTRAPDASDPRQPAAVCLTEASNASHRIHRVKSDIDSIPVTRESTRSNRINWKDWYYQGLERASEADQSSEGRSSSAAQASDHESGYQSSGPTLDDQPLRKLNSADRKTVQKEKNPSENFSRIEKNICDSETEAICNFASEKELPSPPMTTDEAPAWKELNSGRNVNAEDRSRLGVGREEMERAAPVESGRVEGGGTRELEIHVRGGALGVGFSIEGGLGSTSGDRPITVKRIFTGGEHLRDQLKPGSAILRVNDKEFSHMTHYDAWNYLKTLPEGPALLLVDTD